jgi:Flp pilus assembly protein TadB
MKWFLAATLFSLATALSVSPLPRLKPMARIQVPNLRMSHKANTKLSFEEELQFVFNIKSQLHAGVNQIDALEFAIQRAPEFSFANTKQAMASQSNVISALHQDAIDNKFPLLINCANLLEANSKTGSSINGALAKIAQSLIDRRKHEQLIATELASTKATMFVLAGLPIVGATMGLMLGTDSIAWLIGTAAGRLCLILGLTLEIAGWLWVKRLLNRALADTT